MVWFSLSFSHWIFTHTSSSIIWYVFLRDEIHCSLHESRLFIGYWLLRQFESKNPKFRLLVRFVFTSIVIEVVVWIMNLHQNIHTLDFMIRCVSKHHWHIIKRFLEFENSFYSIVDLGLITTLEVWTYIPDCLST